MFSAVKTLANNYRNNFEAEYSKLLIPKFATGDLLISTRFPYLKPTFHKLIAVLHIPPLQACK
jgi:hypothetical protein